MKEFAKKVAWFDGKRKKDGQRGREERDGIEYSVLNTQYSRHWNGEREEDDLLFLLLGLESKEKGKKFFKFFLEDFLLDFALARRHILGHEDEF